MSKKILALLVIVLLTSTICYAEEVKNFTPTQKKVLEEKILGIKIAQASVQDFVRYLSVEYGIDETWSLSAGNSGFRKLPPPSAPKKEDPAASVPKK